MDCDSLCAGELGLAIVFNLRSSVVRVQSYLVNGVLDHSLIRRVTTSAVCTMMQEFLFDVSKCQAHTIELVTVMTDQ